MDGSCHLPHSPDTSRAPQTGEVHGTHYFFASTQQMERDIQNNQFVEHGFLDGHYYGTSLHAIRRVMDSGKTCLLILQHRVREPGVW